MRFRPFAAFVALSACVAPALPLPQRPDSEVGIERAYFATYPDRLFATLAAVCDGPGQTVVRPADNWLLCETLPDPASAAALILNYDGTVTDLPRFVVGLSAEPEGDGFAVATYHYIRVPQVTGPAVEVRLRDPALVREMRRTLLAAGGEFKE